MLADIFAPHGLNVNLSVVGTLSGGYSTVCYRTAILHRVLLMEQQVGSAFWFASDNHSSDFASHCLDNVMMACSVYHTGFPDGLFNGRQQSSRLARTHWCYDHNNGALYC
jgi:hypothetical protein